MSPSPSVSVSTMNRANEDVTAFWAVTSAGVNEAAFVVVILILAAALAGTLPVWWAAGSRKW